MMRYKCHDGRHPASPHCLNHALIIGLDNLTDDEWIDETIYPVISDIATKREHEKDERERGRELTVMRCFLSSTDCDFLETYYYLWD